MHDGRVEIRGSPAGDVARTLVGHSAPVITVAFSASGDLLVTGSDDGLVRVWRVADGGLLRGVAGEGGTTAWLPVFSPDGSLLAVRVGRRLQLVELAGGATRWTADLPDHGGVTALRFTPSADGVVAAHRTGVVELYDSATGDRRHLFEGHTAPVTAIDFDPGGLLVTTSWDGTIRIWDPTDGRQIRSLFGRWGSVFCAALSPDGRRLATGHGDGRARVWDTATWTTVRKLEGPSASIRSIAFSPDGRTVAGGTLHGQVWMWDPISGAPLRASYGSASVLHLVFDPTGTLVVAGDGRGPASVSLWNTAVATFGAAVDDVGRRSNLGACRSTHAVVAVQPFSQDGAVWASEGSCGRYDDVPLAPERRQYRAGMGALTVLGDPPMQVDVDGLPVGWTPLVRFELPYGTHEWCVEALPARTCKSFALDAANRHAVWEFSHTPD
jgi:WD40 repeat protein